MATRSRRRVRPLAAAITVVVVAGLGASAAFALNSPDAHAYRTATVTPNIATTSTSVLPRIRKSQICRSRSASPSKTERSFMAARPFGPNNSTARRCRRGANSRFKGGRQMDTPKGQKPS